MVKTENRSHHKSPRALTVKRVLLRIALALGTTLAAAVCGLFGVVYVLEKGPSVTARNVFVISCLETSAAKFVPRIFLTEEEIDAIVEANSIQQTDIVTDTDMVFYPDTQFAMPEDPDLVVDPDGDGIDLIDVSGATYKGKLMIVYDPSRVFVGISGKFGAEEPGKTLPDLYASYDNVVAAINGGGFDDRAGHGTGGEPWGVVMSEGKVLWGEPLYNTWETIGITYDNKLVVGNMTIQQAIDLGVRDAVKFGPILVVNGEPVESLGDGSGLNPRTAIGQRADGAMLLLVIDGRQSNSLGASLTDVRDLLMKYGAVNAANLDGGSSTNMIYKGEVINQSASLVGFRKMSTAFLVKGIDDSAAQTAGREDTSEP